MAILENIKDLSLSILSKWTLIKWSLKEIPLALTKPTGSERLKRKEMNEGQN